MVFVFGTLERERRRGVVVDRCPNCLDLQWFSLIDHHRAFHAYFVPLGRGKYLYTTERCDTCGTEFPLERERIAEPLPDGAKQELDLDEALLRTNPTLARRFADIAALLDEVRAPYRDPNDDSGRERLERAVEQLNQLERRGVDVERWLERFHGFGTLSAAEQELLCAGLEGFHEAAVR